MNGPILENEFIVQLTHCFARSPNQINGLQQSDAELIRMPPPAPFDLAITTDSIAEEIQAGLYADPYLMGWMAIMVNMSDLAAVGARPLGIVVSETLDHRCTPEFLALVQRGIADACIACGTFVLGGDTNVGRALVLGGCALGQVERGKALMRTGCRPNDLLYATGKLGAGNAFALSVIQPQLDLHVAYLPQPRLDHGMALRGIASACMDTSDGSLATIDQIARLNNVGVQFEECWEDVLAPSVREIAARARVPQWLFLAGIHGEFELIFTVPPEHEPALLQVNEENGWEMTRIGRILSDPNVRLTIDGRMRSIDTAAVRNAAHVFGHDPHGYLKALIEIHDRIVTS